MSQRADSGNAAVKSPPPEIRGEAFGRYRLLERIGAGGMAEIYRAVNVGEQGFERTVAIKRIRDEVGEVADIGKLFADEARLSALLDHPNIVQVYDFGAVDGNHYIAMEYLKGRNLDEVLFMLRRQGQRLDPSLAVFVAHEVARALAYAHALRDEQGRPLDIIHRDISPANIMLLQAGAVKLLDFGIARITSELRLAVTQGQSLRGKCPYLAPEQITGGDIDNRSDIFALGVVLWEMLTGERLFAGDTDRDSIAAVLKREIPAPSTLSPEVPEALDQVVLTLLSRDPEQRYRSADVVAADLDQVMRTLPSRQRDLPALLRRLFPYASGELPSVAPRPPTPPRYEVELPVTPPAGPRPSRLLAMASRETPSARSEVTAKITPLEAQAIATRVAAEEGVRPPRPAARTDSRRALLLVLFTIAATELLAAALNGGFGTIHINTTGPAAAAGAEHLCLPRTEQAEGPTVAPPERAASGAPPAWWKEEGAAASAGSVSSQADKRATRRVRRGASSPRKSPAHPLPIARKK